MLVSMKLLALSIIYIVTGGAVFTDLFRRHKALTLLAALVAIIGTYYLGKSIYQDVVTEVKADARPFVSDVYRDSAPHKFELRDTWGEFELDGNCRLRYNSSVVAKFEFVAQSSTGKSACSYQPKFSVSPSSSFVAVFIPTNDYGYSHLSIVDLQRKEVRLQSHELGFLVAPSDTWSSAEDKLLIKRQVVWNNYFNGFTGAHGAQPCVFDMATTETVCLDKTKFIETVVQKSIEQDDKNACIIRESCHMSFDVESATYKDGNFVARLVYETSVHQQRQLGQPIVSEGLIEMVI